MGKVSGDEDAVEDPSDAAETGTEAAEDAPAAPTESPSIFKMLSDAFLKWLKTTKAKAAIIGFMVITAGLYGLFSYQASSIDTKSLDDVLAGAVNGGGGGDGKDPFAKYEDMAGLAPLSGSTNEGTESPETVSIEDLNVYEVTVLLTWTDEPDSARHTNQPDSFEVVVTAPDGREARGSGSNTHNDVGEIDVILSRNITKEALDNKELKKKTKEDTWTGDWNITVTCTSAGDQEAMFSFLGLRDQADTGNAWTLDVVWAFKAEAS
jgi:hypothetical protein